MKIIRRNKALFAILLILVIASFFRLWQITKIPGGLFPDEAANGLDILLIFQGRHTPFFERGLGREALFFYLQAISVAILGIGVWQLHLVSAIIGILSVLTCYLLAKALFNQRVAFLAAFFMATSHWHTTLSRTGFRAIMLPLMATLFFYFAYLTLKEVSGKKRKLFAALAGLSLGLGFYTYISFRAMVPILLVISILVIIWQRYLFKLYLKEIVIGSIAMILILLPLIIYFIQHPDSFMGRSYYISIFNPEFNQGNLLGTFLEVAKKTFLMFFTKGDLNWRHNVSGFPMLNPFVAIFFILGLIYASLIVLQKFIKIKFSLLNRDSGNYFKYSVLIIWFLGMLGPELVTAESIPHGLRTIGTMPAVFFFSAISLDYFWQRINNRLFLSVILGLALSLSLFYDYYLYFGISFNSPGFYYAYRSDLTIVSQYLNERNLKEETYLVLDPYSVQTPEFLTAENHQPYILLDPAKSYQVQMKQGEEIVFTQSTIFDTEKFEEYHPDVKIIKKDFNQFNQEIMRVYAKE